MPLQSLTQFVFFILIFISTLFKDVKLMQNIKVFASMVQEAFARLA
jgi:hypothetical protein